jgi:hypothetical protein
LSELLLIKVEQIDQNCFYLKLLQLTINQKNI